MSRVEGTLVQNIIDLIIRPTQETDHPYTRLFASLMINIVSVGSAFWVASSFDKPKREVSVIPTSQPIQKPRPQTYEQRIEELQEDIKFADRVIDFCDYMEPGQIRNVKEFKETGHIDFDLKAKVRYQENLDKTRSDRILYQGFLKEYKAELESLRNNPPVGSRNSTEVAHNTNSIQMKILESKDQKIKRLSNEIQTLEDEYRKLNSHHYSYNNANDSAKAERLEAVIQELEVKRADLEFYKSN